MPFNKISCFSFSTEIKLPKSSSSLHSPNLLTNSRSKDIIEYALLWQYTKQYTVLLVSKCQFPFFTCAAKQYGLTEWIESIHRSYKNWDVYMSDYLMESGDITQEQIRLIHSQLKSSSDLHLKMSMRSFRSEKVSIFVNQLLALQKEEATATLRELEKYPIVMTRSLDIAKQWLRDHNRGSERMGLLASSKAERLKAISINVRYQPNFVHWFLEDDSDIRSSNALEDTLTEFKVQGLEIDWACVAWDADLRLSKDGKKWSHHQLRSGTQWQNINKPINQEYQINAYRVLLTRARQGMVIVVPNGDHGVPPDETRKPEWYDGIYNYLKEIGIQEI